MPVSEGESEDESMSGATTSHANHSLLEARRGSALVSETGSSFEAETGLSLRHTFLLVTLADRLRDLGCMASRTTWTKSTLCSCRASRNNRVANIIRVVDFSKQWQLQLPQLQLQLL